MKKEVKRLQFDFSQEVLQRIDTLQEKTDAKSRSAVIKDAIEKPMTNF
jgi:metal-responsive CopG/Arc/MetJ family transcriptional regulator